MDEFQNLVLSNLADIKSELRQHVRDQAIEVGSINKRVSMLEQETALNKQKLGFFSAGVSALVAGLIALFQAWIGK